MSVINIGPFRLFINNFLKDRFLELGFLVKGLMCVCEILKVALAHC